MEIYQQKFGKRRIVEIVGWNNRDIILQEFGSDFRFAMGWDLFTKYYDKLETFDCDTAEYEGADLSNFLKI